MGGRATVEESWLEGRGEYGWDGGEWNEGRWGGLRSRFQGKATQRLLTGGKERGARGEDQSTGDDFITTRHSSTTLKYQKSGGLIQVRQLSARGFVRRGVGACASFLHNAFLVRAKEKGNARRHAAARSRTERKEKAAARK